MLYGMGTVFTFLTLMVFVLFLLAKIVKKYPGPIAATATNKTAGNAINPTHLQAIEQAVRQLSKKQQLRKNNK